MKQLIVHANLILADRIEENASLLLEGDKIAQIFPSGEVLPADVLRIDATGRYVAPGYVDIHVHGGGGYEVNRSTPQEIVKMCEAHAYYGTTSIVPTTLTAPVEDLLLAIDHIKAAQSLCTSSILGVHLEGPFLSSDQTGAQNPAFLSMPTEEKMAVLLERWDGIRMMGAAPELEGGMKLGEELKKRGIVASIAHSDCTFEQAEEARAHGYSDVTHLYSGCSIVKRINAYRVAGLVEAGLYFDDLSVQIIADGKHLPPSLLKLIVKVKGADRISLITDGLSHAATDVKEGDLITQANGMQMLFEDGVFKLPDRQAFAGSASTMDKLVRNMVNLAGVSIVDAVKMASLNPATVLHETAKGSISIGKDADLVFLSKDLEVVGVCAMGKMIRPLV